jgi:hypothetical protein
MAATIKTTYIPQNKFWFELLEVLLAEESDVDAIAYAASWLSLNFSALDQKTRNTLTKYSNQFGKFQSLKILETMEYLFDEDRETELILLIQLLQYVPYIYKQLMHLSSDPEFSSSYRKAFILLND